MNNLPHNRLRGKISPSDVRLQGRLLVTVILSLELAALLSGCTHAQTAPGEPRVKVRDEVFDFGYVPQKSYVSHVFWLKNTGDKLLEISKLVPNCGCTQAPLEQNKVEPGDSARVEIAFGSSLFHRSVRKFTQIQSNAGGRVPALTFTAEVVIDSEPTGPLALTPRRVDIDSVSFGTSSGAHEFKVGMRNTSSAPLLVALIDRPDRAVAVDGEVSASLAPGEERSFVLRFDSKAISGPLSKSMTFLATGTDTNRVTLPIFRGSRPERPGPRRDTK